MSTHGYAWGKTRPFPGGAEDWSGWLIDGLRDKEIYEEFRVHTRSGRPLGEPGFVERLESLLGRGLRPGKRGPKPKRCCRSEPESARKGVKGRERAEIK